jgi:hypothetical protein
LTVKGQISPRGEIWGQGGGEKFANVCEFGRKGDPESKYPSRERPELFNTSNVNLRLIFEDRLRSSPNLGSIQDLGNRKAHAIFHTLPDPNMEFSAGVLCRGNKFPTGGEFGNMGKYDTVSYLGIGVKGKFPIWDICKHENFSHFPFPGEEEIRKIDKSAKLADLDLREKFPNIFSCSDYPIKKRPEPPFLDAV